jgi:hypothetical protein
MLPIKKYSGSILPIFRKSRNAGIKAGLKNSL